MHVIIIAGSAPMLRPIWSRYKGKDYGSSQRNTYDTDSSKQPRIGKFSGSRKTTVPGHYTVALNDLDNPTERHSNDGESYGGSSVDNILPKQPQQATTYGSAADESGIRVTNEVHVGYSQSEGAKISSDGFNGGRMTQHHAFGRSGV